MKKQEHTTIGESLKSLILYLLVVLYISTAVSSLNLSPAPMNRQKMNSILVYHFLQHA